MSNLFLKFIRDECPVLNEKQYEYIFAVKLFGNNYLILLYPTLPTIHTAM